MDPSIKPWMTGSPIWIEAGASALEAHDRMVEFGIRHLPVLDPERRVIGQPDGVEACAAALGGERRIVERSPRDVELLFRLVDPVEIFLGRTGPPWREEEKYAAQEDKARAGQEKCRQESRSAFSSNDFSRACSCPHS